MELSEKPQDDIENDLVPDRTYYKVQLIDENLEGIDQEDCIKVVGDNRIK